MGAGIAAAAAGIVAVSSFTPPDAYASWTASPSRLDGGTAQSLATACADRIRERFADASTRLRPVLGEQRGDFETVLIAARGQVALCADWAAPVSDNTQRGSTLDGLSTDASLSPGRIVDVIAVPGQLNGPEAVRITYGLADPRVSRIVVDTVDGRRVSASVDHGYFLAWWPSGSEIDTLTAEDAAGRTLARVPG